VLGQEVRTERRDAVLVITINRPRVRNALNRAVTEGIRDAVDELDQDRELRAAVLTGAGGTFSAGMDLKAFLNGESPDFEGRGLCGITETPPRKPLLAAVEGWALAGGFELVLACDLVIAARSARFGVPEVKRSLGLVNRVVAEGEALATAVDLALAISRNGPLAVAASKQIARAAQDWTAAEGWRRQAAITAPIFGSADAREGAAAFAEKRDPVFRGE
jgi:enoyl-CoA hydratase/carnithine racemase